MSCGVHTRMSNMGVVEQLELLNIGRIVEREFPGIQFDSLDELRMYLNQHLGTDIQNGDTLTDVRKDIEEALADKAYKRSMGVV